MGRGREIGPYGSRRYQSKRFNASKRFDVVAEACDYREVRKAILSCLKSHGPMKTEDVIRTLGLLGISNRSAIQRCMKYLGQDGHILRPSNQHPWRLP